MNLYVVFYHDKRTDPMIRIFDEREKAIAFAKKLVAQVEERYPGLTEEDDVEGWLYYCRTGESDYVFVEEARLNYGIG